MAISFKRFQSSLAFPPFHHLVTAKFSPLPFHHFTFLNIKLSFFSGSIASATVNCTPNNHHPQPENIPTQSQQYNPIKEFLLKECGLSQSELSKVIRRRPDLIGIVSTQTAQQAVQVLRNVGFTKDQVRRIIVRYPTLVCLNADRQLKPKIQLLGIQGELLITVLLRCPRVLGHSIDSLKFKIDYLRDIGISPSSNRFGWALLALFGNRPEILKMKWNQLASFGLLEDEIKDLFRKCPSVFNVTIDKMQRNMDFLTNTAGLPANIIVTHPSLFTYSLETRIKPRHAVFKFISAMQPDKHIPNLFSIIRLSDEKFLDKYVNDGPYATRLLEIYSGKCVDVDIIQSQEL